MQYLPRSSGGVKYKYILPSVEIRLSVGRQSMDFGPYVIQSFLLVLMLLVPGAVFAQDGTIKKIMLVKAEVTAPNTYTIIARGYPKPGLTDQVQSDGSALEAAVLNAQVVAKERFVSGFDVITTAERKSYTKGNDYVEVTYVITFPNVVKYLKKTVP